MEKQVEVAQAEQTEFTITELVKINQQKEKDRIGGLLVVSETAKKQLMEAASFSHILGNPITADFQRKYQLSESDFPTTESKLAQCLGELRTRLEGLASQDFEFKKSEQEEAIERARAKFYREELTEEEFKKIERKHLAEIADLTADYKNHSRTVRKQTAMHVVDETLAWKENVEHFLKQGGYKSLEEVDWNRVRMGEMEGKIEIFGELEALGQLEMSPPKLNAIMQNMPAFQRGHQRGSMRKQMVELKQHAQGLAKGAIPQLEAQLKQAEAEGKTEDAKKLAQDLASVKVEYTQVEAQAAQIEQAMAKMGRINSSKELEKTAEKPKLVQ